MTQEEINNEVAKTKFKDEKVRSYSRSELNPRIFIVTMERGFQINVPDIHWKIEEEPSYEITD